MRVSYVRKVQDQAKLTPEEIKVLKTTYVRAIVNGHTEVIEELLTRGMPLLTILEHNKTALKIAVEHDSPKVYELVLIESMRTFQLFPHQDIIEAFIWILNKRYYHLIDLTIFALEQHSVSQERFNYFIKINKFFENLVELCSQEICGPHHVDELKDLIEKNELNKDELRYFFNFWERRIASTTAEDLKFYALLADAYDRLDDKADRALISYHHHKTLMFAGAILILTASAGYFFLRVKHLPSVILILGCTTLLLVVLSSYLKEMHHNSRKLTKKAEQTLLNRRLLKASRQGNQDDVHACLQAGAQINAMGGITYATPLHEASTFNYQDLVTYISEADGYDGKAEQLEGSLWDYTLKTPKQEPYPLAQFKGVARAVLLVNIASRDDYTPQLRELEMLYQEFKAKGLVIIAVPSNDFLGKEPLTDEYITEFCQMNYGVTYPITSKIHVVQASADPLFFWLGHHTKPKWNFQKYIFNSEGHLVQSFESRTLPTCEAINRNLRELLE